MPLLIQFLADYSNPPVEFLAPRNTLGCLEMDTAWCCIKYPHPWNIKVHEFCLSSPSLLTYSGVLAIEAGLNPHPNFFYCPCVFNVTFLMINDHQ